MRNKKLALLCGIILTSTFILFFSCKKINEPTELGDGLIPPVDNITTFDTTLDVQVFNDSFTVVTDSTVSVRSYTHYLGQISNDPLFGKTDARIYLELKPTINGINSPFINKKDSLHIDSVVLVLDYVETYGDTNALQTVNVYEIGGQIGDFRYDTTYRIRENGFPQLGLLGSRSFEPFVLNDSIKAYQDTTANQLRIRLDDAFGQRLLDYDTATAYKSDTFFRESFKGFALESAAGNAIMGFNLTGTNTKLAIYYKDDNNDKPVAEWDTAVSYFTFTESSASANLVKRDHNGTPLAAAIGGGATPDEFAYIQATPGTFATLKIPALAGLNNRIVHRAELIMEQVYDPSDTMFGAPPALLLDAYDPTESDYRAIPYDFYMDASGTNLGSFGSAPFFTTDPGGKTVKTWRFNLSRYVQHVVTGTEPVYDLRLHAPVYTYDLYRPGPLGSASSKQYLEVNAAPAKGRVRLQGGDPAGINPQRMRLRIVYSKI